MGEKKSDFLITIISEIITTIILLGLFYWDYFIGIILLGLFYLTEKYIASWASNNNILIILRLIQYLLIYHSIRAFSRCFKKWKYYGTLYKIVEFPNVIYPLIVKPYLKMYLGLMLFLGVYFGGIYYAFKYIPEYFGYDLNYDTKAYLCITIAAILLRTFGNWLIKSIVKWYYKIDNQTEHIELTLFLVNEERIRYFIYILFFFALIIFSSFSLEGVKIFSHLKLPLAILNSFATFIAYDRLFNNRILIKFNPKKHWELLIKVYEKDPKYKGDSNYLIKKTND